MTYESTLAHLFQSLTHKRVLVGMQFEIIADGLVDEVAARTALRGGQGIKGIDLVGIGTKADGFLRAAHNSE